MRQRLSPRRLWIQAKKADRLRHFPAWKITLFMIPYRWRQHLLLLGASAVLAVLFPSFAINILLLLIGFYAGDMLWHYRTGRDWQYTKVLMDWEKVARLAPSRTQCKAELESFSVPQSATQW